MRRKESFLSLARSMQAATLSGVPISLSILSTASFAPPCAGPQREAMPLAMQAKGLALGVWWEERGSGRKGGISKGEGWSKRGGKERAEDGEQRR